MNWINPLKSVRACGNLALVILIPCLASLAWGFPVDPAAVDITQLSLPATPNTQVGKFTVDFTQLAADSGFVNVIDPAHNKWLVKNLPVWGPASGFDGRFLAIRFSLEDWVANVGDPAPSSLPLVIDLSPVPVIDMQDILVGNPPTVPFTVDPELIAIGGVLDDQGNDANVVGFGVPDYTTLTFDLNLPTKKVLQPGHRNIQAARNQCVPAALANSFQYLKETHSESFKFPEPFKPGLGNDGSLVGAFDVACKRPTGSTRADTTNKGTYPMHGKLVFASNHDMKNTLNIKFQGTVWVRDAENDSFTIPKYGDENFTRHGMTVHGSGRTVDLNWIMTELEHGEDVEMVIDYVQADTDTIYQSHAVTVTGAGYIAGLPFLNHISDTHQTNVDPTDSIGTLGHIHDYFRPHHLFRGYNYAWLEGSHAIIRNVISESVIPPVATCLSGFEVTGTPAGARIQWAYHAPEPPTLSLHAACGTENWLVTTPPARQGEYTVLDPVALEHPGGTVTYSLYYVYEDHQEELLAAATTLMPSPPPRPVILAASPNPFNPRLRIEYSLPVAGQAKIRVLDLAGKTIRILETGPLSAGNHEITWNGKDSHGANVASGVYLIHLEFGDFVDSRRVTLVR